MKFSTPRHSISRRKLITSIVMVNAAAYATLVGAPLILAIAAGILIDSRWYIVALMWLFISMPTLLLFIYFSEMLRPESFVNTMPHTLRVYGDDIDIDATVVSYPDDEGRVAPERHINYRFKARKDRSVVVATDSIIIRLEHPAKGVIIVPAEYLPENLNHETDKEQS